MSRRAAIPPVRLRGHHLLCILTFAGRGYSPGFVADMEAIVARIAAGAPVLLVDGPDDICRRHLLDDPAAHCRDADVARRDAAALRDAAGLAGLAPGREAVLDARRLDDLRAAFADGRIRRACAGCSWSEICTALAADGFAGTRLAAGPDHARAKWSSKA